MRALINGSEYVLSHVVMDGDSLKSAWVENGQWHLDIKGNVAYCRLAKGLPDYKNKFLIKSIDLTK